MQILHLSNYPAVVESTRTGEKITIKDPENRLFPNKIGTVLPVDSLEPVRIKGVPPWIKRSEYFFPVELSTDGATGVKEVTYAPYHDLFKYLYVSDATWEAVSRLIDDISLPTQTSVVADKIATDGVGLLLNELAAKTSPEVGVGSAAPYQVASEVAVLPSGERLAELRAEFDSTLPAVQLFEKIRELVSEISCATSNVFGSNDITLWWYGANLLPKLTLPAVPLNELSVKYNVDNYAVAVKALGATDVNGERLQLPQASVIEGKLPQITKLTTHDNIWTLRELELAQAQDLQRYRDYEVSFSVNVYELLPPHVRNQKAASPTPFYSCGILPHNRWRVPHLQTDVDEYSFVVDKVVFSNTNPAESNVYFTTVKGDETNNSLSRVLAAADTTRSAAQTGEASKRKQG